MISPLHSLRWRLQLWHGLILLVTIGAVCIAVYRLAWNNELRRIDKELMLKERTLVMALAQSSAESDRPAEGPRPPSPEKLMERLSAGGLTLPEATATLFRGGEPGFAYFRFQDRDGRVLLQSNNAPEHLSFLPAPEQGFTEEIRTTDRRRESCRSSDRGVCSVVGSDITPELNEMRRFAWSLSAAGCGVWLAGLLGGWWLAGRAIRPIETISRTASRIADGNLEERIDGAGGASELGQLSDVLNRTFDRLQGALERQRQFTADAAHELRTPITILIAETQRILKRERSADAYRSAFETCGQTAMRMRRLVEDLLLLARQEAGSDPSERCNLVEIVRDAIFHLIPLGATKSIQIHSDLHPAECRGEAAALSTVANNLIANAIQHHPGGGHIHVSTQGENGDGDASVTVRDDGPGISAEDLPHIFNRFYRADKARTADAALHTGLGLSIARTIIEAHGGKIECQSAPGEGAIFTVRIPAATRRGG